MDNAELAHAVFDALDAGDFDRFKSCFHDDALIWHNFDQIEQSMSQTVEVLQEAWAGYAQHGYQDRRYVSLPDGAVAQHVLRVVNKDGARREMHAMMHMFVKDGRIARVEEYFDMGQAAKLASD